MATQISRYLGYVVPLFIAVGMQSQDLIVKKSIAVDGNLISNSETSFKGSRERVVTQSPTGTTVTLRQCDLKRTVVVNEQGQSYFVAQDPAEEFGLAKTADGGEGYLTETSLVTDTGERKVMFGFPARHLKTVVKVRSSKNACTQTSQEFEVDGWYVDLSKEQSVCQASLPPIRQSEGCHDRVVRRRSGTGKLGYPLKEAITLHNDDGTAIAVSVQPSNIGKDTLSQDQFEIPLGYHQVQTLAEVNGSAPKAALQQASIREALPTGAATTGNSQAGSQNSAGKIRIGIAPPEAQVGQGNNSGDYSTPVRNAEIALMSGPLVNIVPLDSHVAMQVQAEAQQKQCNYILYSSVVVKHGQVSGFGKFTKFGGMAASVTPIGAMAHGVTGTIAAQAAEAAVSQLAQREAMNELAAFNGQIKSKDDVSVQYQLIPTGQTAPALQNSLQSKAKSDGEDVLTPLLQQAATSVLGEVSKK